MNRALRFVQDRLSYHLPCKMILLISVIFAKMVCLIQYSREDSLRLLGCERTHKYNGLISLKLLKEVGNMQCSVTGVVVTEDLSRLLQGLVISLQTHKPGVIPHNLVNMKFKIENSIKPTEHNVKFGLLNAHLVHNKTDENWDCNG